VAAERLDLRDWGPLLAGAEKAHATTRTRTHARAYAAAPHRQTRTKGGSPARPPPPAESGLPGLSTVTSRPTLRISGGTRTRIAWARVPAGLPRDRRVIDTRPSCDRRHMSAASPSCASPPPTDARKARFRTGGRRAAQRAARWLSRPTSVTLKVAKPGKRPAHAQPLRLTLSPSRALIPSLSLPPSRPRPPLARPPQHTSSAPSLHPPDLPFPLPSE
jgi:hypothetical protein